MKRLTRPFCLVALLVFAHPALAQEAAPPDEHDSAMMMPPPAQDAYLDALAGTFQGTGTIMGMAVAETMTGAWDLGHQFFVLDSSSTVAAPDGTEMTVLMRMYYRPLGDGTYAGAYFDNVGTMGDFTGSSEEGNLVVYWEDPMHGGNHRSVTSVQPDGSFTVAFGMQQPDGSWGASGLMTYAPVAE